MNYRIEVYSLFWQDLGDIARWYNEQVNGLGEDFIDSFYETAQILKKNPTAFRRFKGNFRQVSVKRFPYLIVYEVDDNMVLINNLIHWARNPSKRVRKE